MCLHGSELLQCWGDEKPDNRRSWGTQRWRGHTDKRQVYRKCSKVTLLFGQKRKSKKIKGGSEPPRLQTNDSVRQRHLNKNCRSKLWKHSKCWKVPKKHRQLWWTSEHKHTHTGVTAGLRFIVTSTPTLSLMRHYLCSYCENHTCSVPLQPSEVMTLLPHRAVVGTVGNVPSMHWGSGLVCNGCQFEKCNRGNQWSELMSLLHCIMGYLQTVIFTWK